MVAQLDAPDGYKQTSVMTAKLADKQLPEVTCPNGAVGKCNVHETTSAADLLLRNS